MAQEVGGFFVSIKALVDEGSFRKGISGVNDLANGLKGLLLGGAALFGISASIKSILESATAQGQMLITAQEVNMSADAIAHWQGVMAEAGGDSKAFIESLKQMNREFVNMKYGTGEVSTKFLQSLGFLRLNPAQLMDEDSDQRAKDILDAARKMSIAGQSPQQAMALTGDLLGTQGQQLLGYLMLPQNLNKTVESMYGQAGKRIYNPNRAGAEGAMSDFRKIGNAGENAWNAFSAELMTKLKPTLDKLLAWIEGHQGDIEKIVNGMASLTAALVEFVVGPAFLTLAETLAIITGHWDVAQKMEKAAQSEVAKKSNAAFYAAEDKAWAFITKLPAALLKNLKDKGLPGRDEAFLNLTIENKNPNDIKVTPSYMGPGNSLKDSTDWANLMK